MQIRSLGFCLSAALSSLLLCPVDSSCLGFLDPYFHLCKSRWLQVLPGSPNLYTLWKLLGNKPGLLQYSPCLLPISQGSPSFIASYPMPWNFLKDIFSEQESLRKKKKKLFCPFFCLFHMWKGKSIFVTPLCLEVNLENIFNFETWVKCTFHNFSFHPFCPLAATPHLRSC